jgi:peptidoglycan/xylan/chitin deacetylase (PgdA/CDA1 family)
MLSDIKLIALRLMQQTGFSRALGASRWRNGRLLILGYHGVSQDDEHVWNPELYMTPEGFRSQLELIVAQGFKVLSLAEGLSRLYAGQLPDRALCLTFDDGTVDFHRTVHPLLREFGFPVTLYLTTYYCFVNKPVFPPALAYILWKGRGRTAPYPAALGAPDPMDLRTGPGREAAQQQIWGFAESHNFSAADKHALLAEVSALVGYDFDSMLARRVHHLMNPNEVTEVAREGVDVQLHAHRHRRPLDRELYQREIRDNRAAIEQLTGHRPVHFCYPSGRTHPSFLPWLAEEGVESATTCKSGIAGPKSHPLLLPRLICDSRVTPLEFSSWLSGAAALIPRRRHVPRHIEPEFAEPRPAS